MKPIAPIAAALTLALAACSGEAEAPSDGADVELTVSTTDNPYGSDDAAEVEAPTQAPAAIPPRFQGVWDYTEGTCSPESDMRMEISGNEILFYESMGTLTAIEEQGSDVIVSLAMEGEGETWEQKSVLRIQGNPERLLVLPDPESDILVRPMPRQRCN
ncbi:hypothetical protein MACH24_11220 [Erythrobacter sp. Dej080120_24]|uniref:hypothetical protein n=1 Tax=Erythrobacter sp. Dej080120_24 TaxID=3024837 RepID=UPI002922A1DB|nr:hypothetical protein MACH24_11220 [Erythrobacter sp. Dej080120_24]